MPSMARRPDYAGLCRTTVLWRLGCMTTYERIAGGRDRYGIGALLLYAALSLALFGRPLLGQFSTVHLGVSHDALQFCWFLAWWRYAITHHLNPFLCRVVWAPEGVNLAWSATVPLASWIASPIIAAYGPVAAFNAVVLACPVLAACSTFLLCRYFGARYAPALVGGYIYGFSPYVLAHIYVGHLNLLPIFPVPLAVLLFALRLDDVIGQSAFAAAFALVIVVQFLFAAELAATMFFFGVIMLALAWKYGSAELRDRIRGLIWPALYASIAAAILLSPYLYYMLIGGVPRVALNSPAAYSACVLNFFLPTPTVEIGLLPPLRAVAASFPGGFGEASAYLSPPLIAIIALWSRSHWREPMGRALLAILGVIFICALGPRLHIDGDTLFGMPWKIFTHVPLLKNVLPGRFTLFAFLAAAVIVSIWLSAAEFAPWLRWALGVLVVALSFPNISGGFWSRPVDMPAFFSTGVYRNYLAKDETVIVLPYDSMFWQAQAGMYFRMASGYTGPAMPREFIGWPIVNGFITQSYIPHADLQLRTFMAAHDADAVIVDDRRNGFWAPMLLKVDPSPRAAGGVWIYRASPASLASYRDKTALEMERLDAETRFDTLLAAARKYLADGRDPASLTPLAVQKLGLMPPNWVSDPDVATNNGLWLGPRDGGLIGVGVVGSYEALTPLITKYREDAAQIYFPYPRALAVNPKGNTFMRMLVIVFNREGLARAAARVEKAGVPK
jgi:hypothetical protein